MNKRLFKCNIEILCLLILLRYNYIQISIPFYNSMIQKKNCKTSKKTQFTNERWLILKKKTKTRKSETCTYTLCYVNNSLLKWRNFQIWNYFCKKTKIPVLMTL